MTNVRVNIKGIVQTQNALGEITVRMADAAARKAVRAGARPIITQARANLAALPLKDSTGLSSRSIGVKVKKYRTRRPLSFVGSAKAAGMAQAAGTTVAIIGARRSFKEPVQRRAWPSKDGEVRFGKGSSVSIGTGEHMKTAWAVPANYAHLIEKGARPHQIGRGSSIRRKAGRGIMHPGFHAMPWLEPAITARRAEAEAILARVFSEELAREAIRARSKGVR